ncbi:hypothetical protein ACFT9I_34565 [Streptomyces sp. NPDC057137]|uniref:hypothetical protein n=1 Tax=Streptomyces sp. NPDC057137 TaxID=3346030 RepID=UPI00362F3379
MGQARPGPTTRDDIAFSPRRVVPGSPRDATPHPDLVARELARELAREPPALSE